MALCHLDPFAGIVHGLVPQGLEDVSHRELPADSKQSSTYAYERQNSYLDQLAKRLLGNRHGRYSLMTVCCDDFSNWFNENQVKCTNKVG